MGVFSLLLGTWAGLYYCLLENCGTTVFLHLCQLSYVWTISRQINNALSSDRYHSYRHWSVLSRFWLILSRVCLWGQPHVYMLFIRCVCFDALMSYIRKRKILFWDFSPFMPCSPLWKPISISIAHKIVCMRLSNYASKWWSPHYSGEKWYAQA